MKLSQKEIGQIQKRFEKKYSVSCGISKVGIRDKDAPPNQKDDFCLVATFYKKHKLLKKLPKRFEGVRVFVEIVSEFRFRAQ